MEHGKRVRDALLQRIVKNEMLVKCGIMKALSDVGGACMKDNACDGGGERNEDLGILL